MRGLLAGWAVGLLAGLAAGQSPAVPGGDFLGAHKPPPFTPSAAAAILGPPPAAVLVKPVPAPEAELDPLTGEPRPPRPPLWSGSIDAGLNGATGNTELFNIRGSGHVKRETAFNILTGDLLYTYTNDTNKLTAHQVLSNARDELLFDGSKWSAFGSTLLEYDELRAFRFRVAVYAGAGYTVVNSKDLTVKVRAGAGAVRELGSANSTAPAPPTAGLAALQASARTPDRWVPEFVFGEDFRWAWSDRSSFLSVTDYYPRADDFRQFRVRARVAYEYVLDPATNMIVRFGVQDRYDSSPGNNSKRNDLTYFSTFGVKF